MHFRNWMAEIRGQRIFCALEGIVSGKFICKVVIGVLEANSVKTFSL